MASTNVLVLLEEKTNESIDHIAADVERSGVKVERLLRGSRMIVGKAQDEAAIDRVKNMKSVSAVREEDTISLPPMDPSIPQ